MPNISLETGPDPDPASHALLMSYRDTAHEAVSAPSVGWIATAARHRTRRRTGVAAAFAVALAAAGGTLLAGQLGTLGPQPAPVPPPPSAPATTGIPSPTGAPVPTTPSVTPPTPSAPSSPARTSERPALDIREVNWQRATIRLPTDRAGSTCPTGRFTSRGEVTVVGARTIKVDDTALAHGDLDRDGRVEAVIHFHCEHTEGDSGDGSGQLLVVTERGGELVGLGYAGPVGENYGTVRVRDGILVATVMQRYSEQPVSQERGYRWNGTRFVQVSGPTAFPPR
ncbi:hypothetical protein BDK92_5091 [Micromonospora pisi]|uniref:Uncharacterized protein n=1 Tax=Micromonospora pisi TaxID=589240 RepID=A0A495JNS0_9ACTN|nr:hypothetical protein [Micromonospora pisi]RKR90710.1 hypothetical protein BDK92_5091 [Micromonospora pisi]